ncbi:MAG: TRAP transporter substrate-binding protein, partial [Chloroflexota bacterium]
GPIPEEIESVKVGGQEMVADTIEWLGPFVKDYNIFGAPMAFRDTAHVVKVAGGPIGQAMAEQMRTQHGIRVLQQTSVEPSRHLMTKKPVASVADVQGLKMRVPQVTAYFNVWKAIGANPTPIPWADAYTAVQGGVVDAMEAPPVDIFNSRFGEVLKQMTWTEHLVATALVIINDKVFQAFSKEQQDIMTAGAKEFQQTRDKLMDGYVQKALDGLKAQGVQINKNVDRSGFLSKAKDAVLGLEKDGLWSAGLYEKIQAVQ